MVAIILAAGDSTRMGRPKALLDDPDGRPFAARLVRTFAEAGVSDVIVVTGRDHAAVVEALAADRLPVAAAVVNNPDPSRGQLSSLLAGLETAAGRGAEAILVTLVDVPMVRASTIRAVVDAWTNRRPPIARPAMGDRHGHPVLFDRAVFDELRRAPLAEGAKTVVRAHGDAVVNVPVDDEGSLTDVDTPEDYDAMRGGRAR